jgi:hypothetical protein
MHMIDALENKRETPSELGARACRERRRLKDNPYPRNSKENAEWQEAYARGLLKGVLETTSRL